MRKTLLSITLLMGIMILVQSCAITDLRTNLMIEQPDLQYEKGRALLEKAAEAYNLNRWKSLDTYSVTIHDKFNGLVGKMGNPFPGNEATLQLNYIPNTFTGNGIFQKGKNEGLLWGIQSWNTYSQQPGEPLVFKKDKNITFWIPTYQYFFELPFRLLQADVVTYAGEGKMYGQTYELVFVSWKKAAPQKDIDQYIVWINPENHRVEKVEYTVRDMFKFITGALHFKDFREVEGLSIPFYMPVESNMMKGFLHEIRVTDFKVNQVDRAALLPDKNIELQGDIK